MKVHAPRQLAEALDLLAASAGGESPLTPIAGGTDLLVSWHARPHDALELLDLSGLSAELRPMHWTPAALELGALTTYWDVIRDERATRALPLLENAARQVGAVQIQTRGTWAGNIGNGSPAADGVPVLMAYDATVTLASVRGRREVALCDYYTGYRQSVRAADELIVGIRVPLRSRDVQRFHKVGARAAQAITKVGVAIAHDPTGWRVAANSVGPCVCRCRNMEAALEAGTRFGSAREVAAVLRADVTPIDDVRSTADYRLHTLARLLFHG